MVWWSGIAGKAMNATPRGQSRDDDRGFHVDISLTRKNFQGQVIELYN
jgi:hypothetical protein